MHQGSPLLNSYLYRVFIVAQPHARSSLDLHASQRQTQPYPTNLAKLCLLYNIYRKISFNLIHFTNIWLHQEKLYIVLRLYT